jgi:hypothetical protein
MFITFLQDVIFDRKRSHPIYLTFRWLSARCSGCFPAIAFKRANQQAHWNHKRKVETMVTILSRPMSSPGSRRTNESTTFWPDVSTGEANEGVCHWAGYDEGMAKFLISTGPDTAQSDIECSIKAHSHPGPCSICN